MNHDPGDDDDDDETVMRLSIVIYAWGCAVLFLLVGIFLYIVRTSQRRRNLSSVTAQAQSDTCHHLEKKPNNRSRRIIEEGMKKNASQIKDPPQYHRVGSPIATNGHDLRDDCLQMLTKIRTALKKIHEHNADLMSMRSCLACVEGTWPVEEGEFFLRVYERIVFGIYREGTNSIAIASDEIHFMKVFFYHKVLQELV